MSTIIKNKTNQQILALINQVHKYYTPKLSPFLNPAQCFQAQQILAFQAGDCNAYFSGGYAHAERQRLLLAPSFLPVDKADFEIQLFEIEFNHKFVHLKHSQILGTLANLGLDRECFGDIITDGYRWQFWAEKQFQEFLLQEITRIGHNKVKVLPQPTEQLVAVKSDFSNETIISSSLRMDAVIAAAFHRSRKQVKDLIQSGQVFVNWEHQKHSDYLVTIGDSLSCRGWGRLTILDFLGQTRTNKYQLYLRIFRH
ncbi:RNA-binding protein [Lactobacillus mellis]|uniref:YlmH family RNA-binding protein n=1 Tax=Bombilactobacillus mellis TaxID=1218508 RepID=UPI001580613A|nr:YlmH/Sll1252 family protein [Bombilactobacillus mellis]NUG38533.1 RNA-binding protein [Bombilactobacillus mellis]